MLESKLVFLGSVKSVDLMPRGAPWRPVGWAGDTWASSVVWLNVHLALGQHL